MSWPVCAKQLVVTAHTSAGDRVILDHVDLALGDGEIVGIVGESGSGKTTFVRALVGLLDRNLSVGNGTIDVLGSTVLGVGIDKTATVRGRHVGVVFQDATRSLNPVLKIRSQLREVIDTHKSGTSKEEAHGLMVSALQEMAIDSPERILGSYPHQLSGGQRQRVALALAIITRPEVLLADECTTALDVTTQADVVALLRRLVANHGISLLFVTHDLLLAGELCDRIVVMYGGQVVESGPADRVLVAPSHPYTERLLKAIPAWDSKEPLQGIPGTAPVVTPEFRGCRFAARCPRVLDDCSAEDIALSTGRDSADHVFRCINPVSPGQPVSAVAGGLLADERPSPRDP
jgi:peptide/nickel transport system ATP-binding protein